MSDLVRENGRDLIVGKGIEEPPLDEDKVSGGGHGVKGWVIDQGGRPVPRGGGSFEDLLKDLRYPFLGCFVSEDGALRDHLRVKLVSLLDVTQVGGRGVGDLSWAIAYPWAAPYEENEKEEMQ